MSRAPFVGCLVGLTMLLSGCEPALYVRLFNATGEPITVSGSPTDHAVTIAPGAAADISMPPDWLFVRGLKYSWSYSMRDFYQPRWPLALWQQHSGVMRTFGRIDSKGRIYIQSPPADGGQPHEIPQPNGFPIRPKTT